MKKPRYFLSGVPERWKNVVYFSRSNTIRTCDLTHPKGARYRAAPYPDMENVIHQLNSPCDSAQRTPWKLYSFRIKNVNQEMSKKI
jgi:hypothetical protein